MNYKLLCVDLDGTVLPKNHVISDYTKKTIKLAQELGLHIVISTGRAFKEANYFAKQLGVQASIICANGAYAVRQGSDEVFHKDILGEEAICKIFQICEKYKITPCFHTNDKVIYGNDYGRLIEEKKGRSKEISQEMSVTTRIHVPTPKKWKETIELEKDNILKCVLFHEDVNLIKKIKAELSAIEDLEVVGSAREEHMEVNSKGTSKGKTIALLADLLDINRDEIIAIGDGENDMTMIKFAGLGIAMGNAKEALKEIADYVTVSNEEDGVAKALDKFVLQKAAS